MKKKLNAKTRYEIGRRANAGEKVADLAKEFMIDKSTVYMYKAMKNADNSELLEDNKKHRSKAYFNKTRIDAVMKDFNNGMSVFEVSAKHNCSRTDIWNWKRYRYPDAYYLEIAEQHGYNMSNHKINYGFSDLQDRSINMKDFELWLKELNMFDYFIHLFPTKRSHRIACAQLIDKWRNVYDVKKWFEFPICVINKNIVKTLRFYYAPKLMTDAELKAALKLPTTREELEEAYRNMQ